MPQQQEQLTDSATARLANIMYVTGSIGLIGSIAGVYYSHKTGGGFWRGVGYFLLGGFIFGTAAHLAALPFENKIIKDGVVTVSVPTFEEQVNVQNQMMLAQMNTGETTDMMSGSA